MEKEMNTLKSFLAGEDQPVSFAELFFDLIFVFSVTQVVHLIHGSFDIVHIGRAVLVFWLVWWAWTQFTWALNAADTKHNWVLMAVLVATGLAFFMAVSVPQSFSSHSWWFAASYVAVRSIGLIIYLWVSWPDPKMRSAVRLFALLSVAGLMSAILGGIIGGAGQYWLWGITIVLDMVAAGIGGRSEDWNIHVRHFTERHGLFVIIALGETLIVAASAAAKESWESPLMTVSALAVGITCVMWWFYFYKIKDKMEHALMATTSARRAAMARDAYSFLHFPLLCGLIIYTAAIENAMLNPTTTFSLHGRIALSLGIILFSLSLVFAFFRATGKILYLRAFITLVIGTIIIFASSVNVLMVLAFCLAGLLLISVLEEKLDAI
jgi:low temperature requirement protein LtrA